MLDYMEGERDNRIFCWVAYSDTGLIRIILVLADDIIKASNKNKLIEERNKILGIPKRSVAPQSKG